MVLSPQVQQFVSQRKPQRAVRQKEGKKWIVCGPQAARVVTLSVRLLGIELAVVAHDRTREGGSPSAMPDLSFRMGLGRELIQPERGYRSGCQRIISAEAILAHVDRAVSTRSAGIRPPRWQIVLPLGNSILSEIV
jgi:hypothetical protein